MKFQDLFDLSLKIIATLVAIFGVWKYFEDRSEVARNAARAESLGIVRDYSSPSVLAARQNLVDFWRSQPEFARFIATADTITSNEYNNFVRRVFPNYQKFDEMQVALFRINDYFDTAFHCRSSGLCDRSLLDGFLCDKAATFSKIYAPFFQELNRAIASRDFGRSLQAYQENCSAED